MYDEAIDFAALIVGVLFLIVAGFAFYVGTQQPYTSDKPIKHTTVKIETINGVSDTTYILER